MLAEGTKLGLSRRFSVMFMRNLLLYNRKKTSYWLYQKVERSLILAFEVVVGSVGSVSGGRLILTLKWKLMMKDMDPTQFHKHMLKRMKYIQMYNDYWLVVHTSKEFEAWSAKKLSIRKHSPSSSLVVFAEKDHCRLMELNSIMTPHKEGNKLHFLSCLLSSDNCHTSLD
ncbi:uncharacterized protein LOC113355214 isoform X1 [Papaver somniferum]|uniref:uncharacterized protein LOC113355214 isoform X1 n=1 Tax=Papaver somniferum TaxID=3469 RepID=UPI000E6F6D33|nr:uncharacterized protein LOC113355214 isoform X1 [Papaver somniferum]